MMFQYCLFHSFNVINFFFQLDCFFHDIDKICHDAILKTEHQDKICIDSFFNDSKFNNNCDSLSSFVDFDHERCNFIVQKFCLSLYALNELLDLNVYLNAVICVYKMMFNCCLDSDLKIFMFHYMMIVNIALFFDKILIYHSLENHLNLVFQLFQVLSAL